jgi:hypothetical protein
MELYQSKFNKNEYIKKEEKVQSMTNLNTQISETLESIVLMLSQILKEQNEINKKLDSTTKSLVESAPLVESSKRKIVLNRDASGKIIGADVIDSPVIQESTPTVNLIPEVNK